MPDGAIRRLKLRRAGTCATCLVVVSAGEEAIWDGERKTVTCLRCSSGDVRLPAFGRAGASAQAKGEELREREADRRRALKSRRPITGRLQLAIEGPATKGDSWAMGAVGERKFGAALDGMREHGVLALHDCRIPGSTANIDHIAIGPTGIWVIDTKRYKGLVTTADKGGWLRSDVRLTVGGRDRTALADGVLKQVAHVRRAIEGSPHGSVDVHGALCFVDAEFRMFAKPFEVRGVLVTWGEALRQRIAAAAKVSASERAAIHSHLAQAFGPA